MRGYVIYSSKKNKGNRAKWKIIRITFYTFRLMSAKFRFAEISAVRFVTRAGIISLNEIALPVNAQYRQDLREASLVFIN